MAVKVENLPPSPIFDTTIDWLSSPPPFPAGKWLEYCRCGAKQQPINQSIPGLSLTIVPSSKYC